MKDHIYQVDPKTKQPEKIEAVSFSEIGIKERSDLEEWVINYPDLLGEPLLVITSEFSGFDKTRDRLDVLALDKKANLVVIELKLDARGSLADLQAIRYAAFCSTATADDIVNMHADFYSSSRQEATERICRFLELEEVPEPSNHPRIILAAGSIEDPKIASSVLWLRSFGVDISCVELTPYRIPKSLEIVLVPRILIPIPEARDYMISVEKKEVAQIQHAKEKTTTRKIWQEIADAFNTLGTEYKALGKNSGLYMRVLPSNSTAHYGWRLRNGSLEIEIHLISPGAEQLLEIIKANESMIKEGIHHDISYEKTYVRISLALPDGRSSDEFAFEAATTMKLLIEQTWPLIEPNSL